MLCFSLALMLLLLAGCVGTRQSELCFLEGDSSCWFYTLSPSSSAGGERKAAARAAPLTSGHSSVKCPNLACSEVNGSQGNDSVRTRWE